MRGLRRRTSGTQPTGPASRSGVSDAQLRTHVVRGAQQDLLLTPGRLRRRLERRMMLVCLVAGAGAMLAVASIIVARAPSWAPFDVQADGSPVRWHPCTPLRLVVNPAGAPAGALEELQRAVRAVAQATDLQVGQIRWTDARPRGTGLAGTRSAAPVHGEIRVAWTNARDPLAPLPFGTHARVERVLHEQGRARFVVAAQIALNTDRTPDYPTAPPLALTLRHELAHVVGLAHVDDPGEVMFSLATAENRDAAWGGGDLLGLRRVGRQRTDDC